jgi:hypothetical protein
MSIYYRKITVDTSEPTTYQNGEIWIKNIGNTYQIYIYINKWLAIRSGGIYEVEANADDHYVNVVIQETPPNNIIQLGWIWIKESIGQAYLYLGEYLPLIAY